MGLKGHPKLTEAGSNGHDSRYLNLSAVLDRGASWLCQQRGEDGRFSFCLEANAITDANFLIAGKLLGMQDEELFQAIARRLLAAQGSDGAWRLFPDDEVGDLSSTVEAYFALLLAGHKREEPAMVRARQFIRAHGGLDKVTSLTKVVLAVAGQIPWSLVAAMPIELALLPKTAPISLDSFASYTRVHLPPLMLLATKSFTLPVPPGCELSDLRANGRADARWETGWQEKAACMMVSVCKGMIRGLSLFTGPSMRQRAIETCENYITEHQEPDGTLGSYILATIFLMCALRAQGYPADDPRIQKAWEGLRGLVWNLPSGPTLQPCSSTIWDTALSAVSLRDAGAHASDPVIRQAARYLLDRQCDPGRWGFQDVNKYFPDVDDTLVAVKAIILSDVSREEEAQEAIHKGIEWVRSMQNRDGGWAAFDKDSDCSFLEKIPFNDMKRAMIDPSSADMTGRTLEFLGWLGYRIGDPRVDRALRWLLKDQRPDGSWFGRWGIAYIYGTWCALRGLAAVGYPTDSEAFRRGLGWLLSVQNEDGGFGESAKSDMQGRYVPLNRSTASQTAWAAMALATCLDESTRPAWRRAIDWLAANQESDGRWDDRYPTGSGFAGKIYLQYHSYALIWPLMAMAQGVQEATGLAPRGGAPRALTLQA